MSRVLVLLIFIVLQTTVFADFIDPTAPIYSLRDQASASSISKNDATQEKNTDKQNNLQLNAIIVAGQEKKAIINGRVVKINDSIFDGKIVDITASKVIVQVAGKVKELFLFSGAIKVEVDE